MAVGQTAKLSAKISSADLARRTEQTVTRPGDTPIDDHAAASNDAEAFEMLRARFDIGVRHTAIAAAAAVGTIGSLVWSSHTRVAVIIWALLMAAAIPVPTMMKRGAVSDDRFRSILWKFELAQGVLWPAVTLVAMPADQPSQAVLGSIYVALVLGGANRVSQFPRPFMSFVIPLSIVSTIGFMLHGSEEIRFLGLVVVIVSALSGSTAHEQRVLHDDLVQSMQRNRGLLVDLEASEKELTTTNRLLSEAVHRADQRSRIDPLTEVANRYQFTQQLSTNLRSLRDGDTESLALAYLDLDKFKSVNDTLGHRAGDELLLAVTRRLSGVLHDDDLLARIGGDELVILGQGWEPAELGARLTSVFEHPFSVDGHLLASTASIGVAQTTEPISQEEIMRQADAAQYQAKGSGGGRFVVFVPETATGDPAPSRAPDQSVGP